MKYLSEKVLSLAESKTIEMARKAGELKAQGVEVTNLTLGETDFTPFDFFKEAAKEAIDKNICRYSPVPGVARLRESIAQKFARDNKIMTTVNQIVVSTGAKQSIANLLLSILNPGDEVILPAPYWVTYYELVQFAGGEPRVIFAGVEQGFKITPAQLEQSITPQTKAFLFSNPCNPTGAVYSESELDELVRVFEKYPNILLISDEIYEHIIYDQKLKSLGSYPSIDKRVVTINGLSKGFSVTGWRLGYLTAPSEIAQACQKIQSQFTSGANIIAQEAAITALSKDPSEIMPSRAETFKKRRDILYHGLKKINSIEVGLPEGAFYLFPNISAFFGKTFQGKKIKNSQDVAMILLEKFYLGTTPGLAFGAEGYLRLSYAASTQELEQAVAKMTEFSQSLS